MGIERFFNSLRTSSAFRVVYDETSSENILSEVEILLLDFNSVIHTISAQVSATLIEIALRRAESAGEYKIEKSFDLDEHVINAVVTHVRELRIRFPKCRFLGLFIDGVPNYGKIITQRSRRYFGELVGQSRRLLLEVYRTQLDQDPATMTTSQGVRYNQYKMLKEMEHLQFDKAKISPGTLFMDRMEKALQGTADLISGFQEHGEGEMKLVIFLRQFLSSSSTSSEKILVFSPDADVILLTLLEAVNFPHNEFYIYRSIGGEEKTHIIHITALGTQLVDFIKHPTLPSKQVIQEAVILLSILGNDFIPKLFNSNNRRHIEAILRAYSETVTGQSMLLEKGTDGKTVLNWSFLGEICRRCAKTLDGSPSRPRQRKDFVPTEYMGSNTIAYYHHLYDLQHLQGRYFRTQRKAKQDNNKRPSRDDLMVAYCEGMAWMVVYYIDHCADESRAWYYPYENAPTLTELSGFLQRRGREVDFQRTLSMNLKRKGQIKDYFTPLSQLMYITHTDIRSLVDTTQLSSKQIEALKQYSKSYLIDWRLRLRFSKDRDRLNLHEFFECSELSYFLSQCQPLLNQLLPLRTFVERYRILVQEGARTHD